MEEEHTQDMVMADRERNLMSDAILCMQGSLTFMTLYPLLLNLFPQTESDCLMMELNKFTLGMMLTARTMPVYIAMNNINMLIPTLGLTATAFVLTSNSLVNMLHLGHALTIIWAFIVFVLLICLMCLAIARYWMQQPIVSIKQQIFI